MDFSDPFWDTPGSDVEFSPTWEEFAWSFVKLPGHLALGGIPTTEELLYFNMHMAHFGIHYAVHAARVGTFAAWDTFAGYRMASMLSRPYHVATFLATPVGLGAAAIVGGGAYVGHKIMTTEPGDPWYHILQNLGENIRFSV